MQTFINNIRGMALAAIALFAMTSCVYDDVSEEPDVTPQDDPMLVLNLKLPKMPATRAAEYEPGTGYENYINTTYDGFRIYLFDENDRFIMRFIPMMLTPNGGNGSDTYTVIGKANDLQTLNQFKVVVLANWRSYSDFDNSLTKGSSTIEDLCNHESSKFSRLTQYELNSTNTIPFYGVHHYTGVTFEKGKRTTLSEPITLLRAMAKIEVIFDNPGLSLDDVILHGVNSRGYCAPKGVYAQGDYDHNGVWSEDYVKTLHLPGDANDSKDADGKLVETHLLCTNPDATDQPQRWVCYVPEYRNTLSGDGTGPAADRAWLELKLSVDGITLENVYFTDYSNNNPDKIYKSVSGTDFDLYRNNCYRFNVSLGKGGLIINVKKWFAAYDNHYVFE